MTEAANDTWLDDPQRNSLRQLVGRMVRAKVLELPDPVETMSDGDLVTTVLDRQGWTFYDTDGDSYLFGRSVISAIAHPRAAEISDLDRVSDFTHFMVDCAGFDEAKAEIGMAYEHREAATERP